MTPTPDWEEARAAFEAGDSARAVALRLGVTHTTVARRARREGWAVASGDATHQGGARGARREAARPARPDDGAPTRPGDLGPLLAGDAEPPLDLTNPAHQRAIVEAAAGIRRGPALEDHLEALLEEQREQRAERVGYRPPGWLWRTPF